MTLSAGTKLGPYEITGAIGAGGMGEVYRARDAKLGRDVALKVLPEAFARDVERMARFQREAKVLASLNHPNIATIHELEDSGKTHALVMELVEGPTLADRIKSGPIPINEALPIAKQMCDALEYAHERGIVHRDLKPANVKVTSGDAVKVLDFGLAKAIEGDAASIDIATSPTISRMATLAGVLLGTAAYMSPEQAKGKVVDRRADIWGFGCVLFEMLTGKMAFSGESVTDTLAAVIKEEPDWSQLPAATPVRVRVLLQRCLQKDPKQRLRDIGDARISLDEVLSGAPQDASFEAAAAPRWRRMLPWTIAATAVAVAAMAVAFWAPRRTATTPAAVEPVRFQISLPEKMTTAGTGGSALSPDGHQLAFAAAGSDGVQRLWVRALDSLEARPLPGSELPDIPIPFFWSPDSRYIAFYADGKLKKTVVSGGAVEVLCDLQQTAVGGSWSPDGVIIFGQARGGLMRVSANGGDASPVTILDSSRGENHHVFPSFLPDGRHFIYLRTSTKPGNSGVYVGSLDAKPDEQDTKLRLATHFAAAYVPSSDPYSGQLLFVRDGALLSQSFDARRLALADEAVTVVDHIGAFRDHGFFSSSANGVLVYRTGGGANSQLRWFDRQGKVLGMALEVGPEIASLSLSSDGTRAAVGRASQGKTGLWLVDLSRGTSTRFTFGPANAFSGIWSPDGSRIIFAANSSGESDLYQKLASGVKDEELLLKSTERAFPTSWSRDGRFVLFTVANLKTPANLWVLPLQGDRKPIPFLQTEFNEGDGHFSPDGHWIAYVSDESGRNEIYVQTFSPDSAGATSGAGTKVLISTEGGSDPRWRGDGKELYYVSSDGTLTAVDVTTSPRFQAGVPKALFRVPPASGFPTPYSWDLAPGGKRFLFPAPPEQDTIPFTVVLNWQAGLKK
ncbi:MAG TPA: protein kinase [Candidatus Acidoferrales bacterium]|nr:protein kinase [Candidatus Acidoferrales bacterium]